MKPLIDYLNKDYPVVVYRAPEGGYVAEIEDLPGCITEGDTLDEAFERIEDARRAWIEVAYEDGQDIPLPRIEQRYSGKFMTRTTKSLHRKLAELATREGVSLNHIVQSILSAGVSEAVTKNYAGEVISKIDSLEKTLNSNKQVIVPVPVGYYQWSLESYEPGLAILGHERAHFSEEVFEGVSA